MRSTRRVHSTGGWSQEGDGGRLQEEDGGISGRLRGLLLRLLLETVSFGCLNFYLCDPNDEVGVVFGFFLLETVLQLVLLRISQ
jgi:hypothetical protein